MVTRLFNGLAGALGLAGQANVAPAGTVVGSDSIRQYPNTLYALLRDLAGGSNAYATIAQQLGSYGLGDVALQGLRNPTNAACSVYELTLWPGTIRRDNEQSALPLESSLEDPEPLYDAVHQIWQWSNWGGRKDEAAYDAANLGDQLFRIASDAQRRRVWFELVSPEYLTDLDVDGRGYLRFIRLDIPQVRRGSDGTRESYWHTEVWDKAAGRFRRWEHRRDVTTPLERLGTPVEDEDIEQRFGFDFVPFRHWRFRSTSSDPRGLSVIGRALDKIVYGDQLVTALHQRLTNHNIPDKVLESDIVDEDGRPVIPPTLGAADVVRVGASTLYRLPGGWRLRDTVAALDYLAHLETVEKHYAALRKDDLPELAYFDVSEAGSDLSGKALTYKLTPARARIDQARGRAETELIAITQMCLSVAQMLGVPGMDAATIGDWESGAFDFWIADRPIVPLSQQEQSELDTAAVARVAQRTQAGMSLLRALLAEDATLSEEDARLLAQADVLDGVRQ